MNWTLLLCFVLEASVILQANGRRIKTDYSNKIVRRKAREQINRNLLSPVELPINYEAKPGHTLLRPLGKMLKSAAMFPLRDMGGALVYGNMDNLGIAFGKTPYRVQYTGFRKNNKDIMDILHKIHLDRSVSSGPKKMLVIEVSPKKRRQPPKLYLIPKIEQEDLDSEDAAVEVDDYNNHIHRQRKKSYTINRRTVKSKSNSKSRSRSESDSTVSESEEANPGNPYTVHKGKYKANWLWKHDMDGDHMNINPLSPQLVEGGIPGDDLFFGRKWWWFNQDDYKPLG